MKKTLVSLFSLSLLSSVNAACDNATSFSGAFGGLGAVISFDKDSMIGSDYQDNKLMGSTTDDPNPYTFKKSRVCRLYCVV